MCHNVALHSYSCRISTVVAKLSSCSNDRNLPLFVFLTKKKEKENCVQLRLKHLSCFKQFKKIHISSVVVTILH